MISSLKAGCCWLTVGIITFPSVLMADGYPICWVAEQIKMHGDQEIKVDVSASIKDQNFASECMKRHLDRWASGDIYVTRDQEYLQSLENLQNLDVNFIVTDDLRPLGNTKIQVMMSSISDVDPKINTTSDFKTDYQVLLVAKMSDSGAEYIGNEKWQPGLKELKPLALSQSGADSAQYFSVYNVNCN